MTPAPTLASAALCGAVNLFLQPFHGIFIASPDADVDAEQADPERSQPIRLFSRHGEMQNSRFGRQQQAIFVLAYRITKNLR